MVYMATETLDQTLDTKKQEVIDYVKLQLGEGIIDTELDAAHYEAAYQRTIGTYRQRAENAFEESYNFLTLREDTNIYTLPNEVQTERLQKPLNANKVISNYLFITYIVTSKPKRISVAAGVVHIIFILNG